MRVQRIGFAYNPTNELALELRDRAAGWCRMRGIDEWASPAGDLAALVAGAAGDATCSSCSAATARSCGPRGPWPRSTSRSSASTSARSASCRRRRRTSWRRCSAKLWPARSAIERAHGPRGRDPSRRAARPAERFIALNDVVIARGSLARVVRLDVAIDDSHLATFVADGLVVASPTGSTGYSFSAGGPILDPQSRNLVVTPIAGYLSAIRSIVVSAAPGRPLPGGRRARGPRQHRRPRGPPLDVGDIVEVRALERPIRFVEPHGALPFWDLLRTKVELLPS